MSKNLVVMGQGYVGLPLSQLAALEGWKVRGFEVNQGVIDGLNSGKSHVDDISDEEIQEILALGYLATHDERVLAEADVIVVCVPTPLAEDGSPNLAYVLSTAKSIGQNAQPGTLVILESTTYPGTTEREFLPAILAEGRLRSEDIRVAFSPERIDPGNKEFRLKNTPKIVGGRTAQETRAAANFYGEFIESIVEVNSPREAEMAKLLENTYRHVNIALVNELVRFAHELDIDLWSVISASATKPFGFEAFFPGPGVGGHCIPIDPNYLSYEVKRSLGVPFRFVELAQEVNGSMPSYVVSRVQDLLNDQEKSLRGAQVLLLGATYKAGIADQRESPSKPVAELLLSKGAVVSYFDPFVPCWELAGSVFLNAVENPIMAAEDSDIVVILQSHPNVDYDGLIASGVPIFDTRGKLEGSNVSKL